MTGCRELEVSKPVQKCPLWVRAGLTLKVLDEVDDSPLLEVQFVVTTLLGSDRSQEDFRLDPKSGVYSGLTEGVGTHRIDLSQEGYASASLTVTLLDGVCNVITQDHVVRLKRL